MEKKETGQQLSEAEISMVLDTYMYMNYQDARAGENLEQILMDLKNHPDYGGGGIHSGEYSILSRAAQNPEIGELVINCQSSDMGYDSGTTACTFSTPEKDTIYVVYRGTGDGEWPDNGIGMTEAATVQQRQALAYFDEAIDYLDVQPNQRLVVTGHSKGGNKAQYVAMATENNALLDVCYSVDGQGFSEAAIDGWKAEYGQTEYGNRIDKLYGINGENDYVSVLGNGIISNEHIRYIKTPVEKSNFAGYHDIKYMFASLEYNQKTGEYTTVFYGRKNCDADTRGELGDYAATLSKQVMSLEPEKRDGCAAVIMQLMEATGGQKGGINGEKLTFSDLKDFAICGLPVIANSFLNEEGQALLRSLTMENSFTDTIQGGICLSVNYQILDTQTEEIRRIAELIKRQAAELQQMQNKISRYMSDGTGVGHGISLTATEMEAIGSKLIELSQTNANVANAYRIWDKQIAYVIKQDCFFGRG